MQQPHVAIRLLMPLPCSPPRAMMWERSNQTSSRERRPAMRRAAICRATQKSPGTEERVFVSGL